jgi:hypothetical protein
MSRGLLFHQRAHTSLPVGDPFCGDLFINRHKPTLNFIIDGSAATSVSVEKLKRLNQKKLFVQAWLAIPDGTVRKKLKKLLSSIYDIFCLIITRGS